MKQASQRNSENLSLDGAAAHRADALTWVGGMLRNCLCRVYAVRLAECFKPKHHMRLVERLRRAKLDPARISQLEATLHAWEAADALARCEIVEQLAPIIFEGVDRILEQARTAGRDRSGTHLAAARFGQEIVILADPDPQRAWLLPTTQTRLREALAELGVYPTAADTQDLDLRQGDVLVLLGAEFRCDRDRHGSWRVQYQPIAMPAAGDPAAVAVAGAKAVSALHHERAVKPENKAAHILAGRDRRAPARAQAPAHEQPEAVGAPKAKGVSRWHSLLWLWPFGREARHHDVTGLSDPAQCVPDWWRQAAGFEVGWRHLPITLYPVLGVLAGWNSLPAWLCLATAFTANGRRLLRQHLPAFATLARRRWLELALVLSGLAVLCGLAFEVNDVWANRSREVPAFSMPPGFSLGQYNADPPWGTDLMEYILYVPPHFEKEKGPFPLVVFLHGYGKRKRDEVLGLGVPYAIANHFGARNPYGRFEFVAFCPIDPGGVWQTGSPEVENNMKALDHVMRRHRIDPQRVYLTGISTGGNGVWRLAEAYPDKWAAIAPFAALIVPGDLRKVRQFPTWIFHGAKDKLVPVEQARTLVRQLKEAKADVRYTELPDLDHHLKSAYYSRELYDWFAQQRKKD